MGGIIHSQLFLTVVAHHNPRLEHEGPRPRMVARGLGLQRLLLVQPGPLFTSPLPNLFFGCHLYSMSRKISPSSLACSQAMKVPMEGPSVS